jgi:hypothetical protein
VAPSIAAPYGSAAGSSFHDWKGAMKKPKRLLRDQGGRTTIRDDPTWMRHNAIHEAAHVVAAAWYGRLPDRVTINESRDRRDSGKSHGCADFGNLRVAEYAGKGIDALMPWIVPAFAGPAAESKASGEPVDLDGGGRADLALALKFAEVALYDGPLTTQIDLDAIDPSKHATVIDAAIAKAREIVDSNWEAINILADALIARRRLFGRDVARILEGVPVGVPSLGDPVVVSPSGGSAV